MAKRFRAEDVGVSFPRHVAIKLYPFMQYFKGFENVAAVRRTFGPRTAQILKTVKVEFFSSPWGFMGVSDEDGHLVVSAHYLRTGKPRDIYLDVVHELVHVKQFLDGRKLFPEGFEYADAPTEIEAYRTCLAEGRRLGLTDRDLFEYLKVPWVEEKDLLRLARNVGIKVPAKKRKKKR